MTLHLPPIERWRDVPRRRPLYLYGAGEGGELILAALSRRGHRVAALIDARKSGTLSGVPILTPEDFSRRWRTGDIVLITSQFHDEIGRCLELLAGPTPDGQARMAGVLNAQPLIRALQLSRITWGDLALLAGGLLRFTMGLVRRAVLRPRRGRNGSIDPHRPLVIRHCPTLIGGNPQALAAAERALGQDSLSVAMEPHEFGYTGAEILFRPGDSPGRREVRRLQYLMRLIDEADIVHFNFGQSLMMASPPPPLLPAMDWRTKLWYRLCSAYQGPGRAVDLPLLRWFGKVICVTYQGDDARIGEFCRSHFAISFAPYVDANYYAPDREVLKLKGIARLTAYADRVYALNPDLLHTLPAGTRFLPYACPLVSRCNTGDADPPPTDPARPLRLIHAPSHRAGKGTRFLLEAVERLRTEGLAFEFELVEGMSHEQAVERYRSADLLIDQLLCGWFGVLGVELMALGKPVICYIRDEDRRFLPPDMDRELPVINATPDSITDVLRYWLTEGRAGLPALGRRSRDFVRRWFLPETIADGLIGDYRALLQKPPRRPIRP